MEHIVWAFLISSFLFFLYNTDAFVEYVSLFRLKKVFRLDKYEEHLRSYPLNSYWDFILYERSNFLTKLISCPICVSVWLNLGFFSYFRDMVALIFNIWFTLFLYFLLRVMFNKAYNDE